jgi:hypothetical protein
MAAPPAGHVGEDDHLPGPSGRPGPRRRTAVVAVGVGVLVILVAVLGGMVLRGMLADVVALPEVETIDRSEPAVLLAVRDMAELRAASGQYHVIVDVERDVPFIPASIAGERILFVALGTVDAAVDLSGLGADAVEVGPDGTSVALTLPPATLTPPRIDPDGSYVYDRQQGLIDRVESAVSGGGADEQVLYQQATDMLADAAADSDLQQRAEANTRDILGGLLHALGFTDVDITFEQGPTQP